MTDTVDIGQCLMVQLEENKPEEKIEVKCEPENNDDEYPRSLASKEVLEGLPNDCKSEPMETDDKTDNIKQEDEALKPTEKLIGLLLGQALQYKKRRKSVPTSNMRVPCTVCGDMFHPSSLKRHLRLHTDEKPFGCSICEKTFRDASSLKFHEKVHSDDRAFQCEQCSKSFVRLNEYKRHKKRIHDEIKDHVCETCGQAFMMESNLKKHMYVDHGLGIKFDCERCGNPFYTPNGLKRHSLICADKTETIFQCTECGKTYPSKSKLEAHAVAHTGERNFKCNQCDKTFLHAGSLINHSKSAHFTASYSCHQQPDDLPSFPHHPFPSLSSPHPFSTYYINRN